MEKAWHPRVGSKQSDPGGYDSSGHSQGEHGSRESRIDSREVTVTGDEHMGILTSMFTAVTGLSS